MARPRSWPLRRVPARSGTKVGPSDLETVPFRRVPARSGTKVGPNLGKVGIPGPRPTSPRAKVGQFGLQGPLFGLQDPLFGLQGRSIFILSGLPASPVRPLSQRSQVDCAHLAHFCNPIYRCPLWACGCTSFVATRHRRMYANICRHAQLGRDAHHGRGRPHEGGRTERARHGPTARPE